VLQQLTLDLLVRLVVMVVVMMMMTMVVVVVGARSALSGVRYTLIQCADYIALQLQVETTDYAQQGTVHALSRSPSPALHTATGPTTLLEH
jgi:predicted cobalt transporter CbtA